jgi:hypothetical protein
MNDLDEDVAVCGEHESRRDHLKNCGSDGRIQTDKFLTFCTKNGSDPKEDKCDGMPYNGHQQEKSTGHALVPCRVSHSRVIADSRSHVLGRTNPTNYIIEDVLS